MKKSFLIAAIALLMGLLTWLLFGWQPTPEAVDGTPLVQEPAGGDFTLQGPEGKVALSDFRGKVVLLYFGYTWCPDICPTNLSLFSRVMNALEPAEQARVQPLFVSVDPRRDTLPRLKEYAEYFHERLIGITGSDAEVARVARLYGVAYRAVNPDTEANYAVDHSADTYLIDPQGRLLQRLPHGSSAETLLQAIRRLLSRETQQKAG
jgi:protein SCO1/2